MDPGEMMNDGSYNLSEIWQYPITGGNESGIKRASFGSSLDQFEGTNPEDTTDNDTVSFNQRLAQAAAAASVVDSGGGSRKRPDMEDEWGKFVPTCTGNGLNESNGKRLKISGSLHENYDAKVEAEHSSRKPSEQHIQKPEPPKDYIHVRARRGQATDSHSLAERARREKISERMKILQDLVPGCNKVIGKALVLDEIINYIQSLQRQVEFLSMKLEAVNTRINPGIEVFPPKEYGQQTFETAGVAFSSQTTREYSRGSSPEWLHMQIGGSFGRTT